MHTKLRVLSLLLLGVLSKSVQASGLQIDQFDYPFIVSKHVFVTEKAVLEAFDERCHDATGHYTTLDKTKAREDVDGFIDAVAIYNLAYLRCEGWENEHELGVVLMGSGGSEWAVTVGDQWIVRVRAMSVEVKVMNPSELSISAFVHPTYCENAYGNCVKALRLRNVD